MSVSDKEVSGFGVGVSGVDDDDDDDVDGGVHRKKKKRASHRGRYGLCGFSFSKKNQRQTQAKGKGKGKDCSSSGSGNVVDEDDDDNNNNSKKGCRFCCFTRCSTVGRSVSSPNGSQTSDPNDPNFTYDMLRVLIERSDFFCKQCNTHFDSDHVC